jgi:uncharacterized membrane protein
MANNVTAPDPAQRLDAIDLLRGLVMVVMLLDHTRDYVHEGGYWSDPLDPATSNPVLYLTRWITHLCAPTFVLLAGASTGIQALRGVSRPDLTRFLWTRGLWLVFLELTVVRTLVWFNWNLSMLAQLQVIWAIGCSMLVLSVLIRLPMRVVGVIGLCLVAGHNLLDLVQVPVWLGPESPSPTFLQALWMLLHQGGSFPVGTWPAPVVWAMYPVLPWLGLMAVGYAFAGIFALEPTHRRRTLLGLGLAMPGLFFVLRLGHLYGDPIAWSQQATTAQTIMSFLNVQKYGPSLQYALVTLAPGMLLLAWMQGRSLSHGVARALVTFGRVPMFFYLLQWATAHLAGIVVSLCLGKEVVGYFLNDVQLFGMNPKPDMGGPLWMVYVCWGLGTLLLYCPCRWYAGVKARRKDLLILRYL